MKLNTWINVGLLFLPPILGLVSCADPTEVYKRDIPGDEVIDRSSLLVYPNTDQNVENPAANQPWSSLKLIQYTDRIKEIETNLERMRASLTSENKLTLPLGGELYDLSKRILDLKLQMREALLYPRVYWEAFEPKLIEELEELEASLAELGNGS
nr:hypothetical protein [Cytophagales bacterium]